MTVGEICSRNVIVAPKSAMVVDAARRMRTAHVGALVVVETRHERQHPVGVLTDRDIVIGAVAGDPDHINYLLVSDVMTPDPVTAREDVPAETALKLMQTHGIRRLPIVDASGALVGILTLDDLLLYLTERQNELVALVANEQHYERFHRA